MLKLKWVGIGIGIWLIGGIALGILMVLGGGDSMGSGLISGIAASFIGHRGYRNERNKTRTLAQSISVQSPEVRDSVTF